MPQSVTIAAFMLGAVLLLIALLGGGFKIFGAEVSGTAGRVGRSERIPLFLLTVYAKAHKTDLSPAEKAAMRRLVAEIVASYFPKQ